MAKSLTMSIEMVHKTFTRPQSVYKDESERFVLQNRTFQRQYAHIYAVRLWNLRPKLEMAARKRWGADAPIRRLSELQRGENCIIVGTLYKQMKLKPSILKELSEQNGLVGGAIPVMASNMRYTDPSDELILEDEVQRLSLSGSSDVDTLISGTVIALFGQVPDEHTGKFVIDEIVYPEMPFQVPRPVPESDRFLVFVSGLEIGCANEDLLSRQLLADILTGNLGDEAFQETMSRVVRVVIAGNSLSDRTRDRGALSRAKYLVKKTVAGTRDAVVGLDDFLVQLASGVNVDLMPGEFDPASFTMPQQQIHRCMLPRAAALETMHCVTNPYDFVVDGVRLLGTSGQPVSDVLKFTSGLDNHLAVLEATLIAGHLAPTAPDTLGCYPFADRDPFIINECPHVLFTGNATDFASKVFRSDTGASVLLLSIPCFASTKSFVSVNLRTMECREFLVEAAFSDGSNGVDVMDES